MSAWKKVIATAKIVLTIHGASVATENEAAKYVKSLGQRELNRLEQQLRKEGKNDALTWISRNT